MSSNCWRWLSWFHLLTMIAKPSFPWTQSWGFPSLSYWLFLPQFSCTHIWAPCRPPSGLEWSFPLLRGCICRSSRNPLSTCASSPVSSGIRESVSHSQLVRTAKPPPVTCSNSGSPRKPLWRFCPRPALPTAFSTWPPRKAPDCAGRPVLCIGQLGGDFPISQPSTHSVSFS